MQKMKLIDFLVKAEKGEIENDTRLDISTEDSYTWKCTYESGKILYEYGDGKESFVIDTINWLKLDVIVYDNIDSTERRYLSDVIRPFKNKVKYIKKLSSHSVKQEYICIKLENGELITFPSFKEKTMYKGMKPNKEYTLKELGL